MNSALFHATRRASKLREGDVDNVCWLRWEHDLPGWLITVQQEVLSSRCHAVASKLLPALLVFMFNLKLVFVLIVDASTAKIYRALWKDKLV